MLAHGAYTWGGGLSCVVPPLQDSKAPGNGQHVQAAPRWAWAGTPQVHAVLPAAAAASASSPHAACPAGWHARSPRRDAARAVRANTAHSVMGWTWQPHAACVSGVGCRARHVRTAFADFALYLCPSDSTTCVDGPECRFKVYGQGASNQADAWPPTHRGDTTSDSKSDGRDDLHLVVAKKWVAAGTTAGLHTLFKLRGEGLEHALQPLPCPAPRERPGQTRSKVVPCGLSRTKWWSEELPGGPVQKVGRQRKNHPLTGGGGARMRSRWSFRSSTLFEAVESNGSVRSNGELGGVGGSRWESVGAGGSRWEQEQVGVGGRLWELLGAGGSRWGRLEPVGDSKSTST
eukprot:gene24792-biopygen1405